MKIISVAFLLLAGTEALSSSGSAAKLGNSYLGRLSDTPKKTIIDVSPGNNNPPQTHPQEKRPVTPFSVPANADNLLGYYSQTSPRPRQQNRQPVRPYNEQDDYYQERRPQDYAPPPRQSMPPPPMQQMNSEEQYWRNKYGNRINSDRGLFESNQNYASYRTDGNNNGGNTHYTDHRPDIQMNGKQYYRYIPNQGANNYNGYHYQDNFGQHHRHGPGLSRVNEYNNPLNNLYYRNNYNQYNGYNNVDHSGAKYYYDTSTGRQYNNYQYNNNLNRSQQRSYHNYNGYKYEYTGAPKYYVNKSTQQQVQNPNYYQNNNSNNRDYSGQTHHTKRQGSISGVMGMY